MTKLDILFGMAIWILGVIIAIGFKKLKEILNRNK